MSAVPTAPRTVLVLSGGGAKTAAHLGAARALGEAGIVPAHYVGTSIGAVVAVALAAGMRPDDVATAMQRLGRVGLRARRLAAIAGIHLDGLLQPDALRAAIGTLLPVRRFSECATPVSITAVDVGSGQTVVFGTGGDDVPVIDACMASAALPVFLPAVNIGGRRFVDGGLRGVVPITESLLGDPERVIAVDVGPRMDAEVPNFDRAPPLIRAHSEAIGVMMAANTVVQVAAWRANPARPPLLVVVPRLDRNGTFRVEAMPEFVAEGYRSMKVALGQP